MRLLVVSLCLHLLRIDAKAVSFISIGDWGGSGLGGEYAVNQKQVADQMAKTASDAGISFVVNVGDNFYYCGITNTSDPQIQTDFENVYTDASLQVPWYSTLGNHEYGYNVEAQLQYKDPKGRWTIDSRYYTKRVQLTSDNFLSLIVLDTSPCIQDYRNTDPANWDPCGSDFPTCAPIMEGQCEFHPNIMTQDCSAQLQWFNQALTQVPKDDWLIIVGHHKAFEIDVADFLTPMMSRGFDLYLNGHTHTLDQYSINGKASFVTTGAGSMIDTADQHSSSVVVDKGQQTVFNDRVAGFTLHTFSDDFSTLTTEYIDYQGNNLHSFTVTRGSGPGPSPPPSGQSCKVLGCGHYRPSEPCQCNSYCTKHQDCCSDYASTCGGSPPSPPSPTESSCKVFGCGKYRKSQACQCNKYCDEHHDCCSDYNSTCGGSMLLSI